MGHSINKGYFSGKYILRVWGRSGETLHNSVHDTPKQACDELAKYQSVHEKPAKVTLEDHDAERALGDLPTCTVREGFERDVLATRPPTAPHYLRH